MRILSVVTRSYYGDQTSIEPMYFWFTEPLQRLGHNVEQFDHIRLCGKIGPDACGEQFVEQVRRGGYDVVLYQTGGADWMARQAIAEAARLAPIIAWNGDDDWQWHSYTKLIAPYFTFMATTYPHIYAEGRQRYPNLLLSQWGCLAGYGDFHRTKDLDFTFAGQIYRSRVEGCRQLRKQAGLKVYGLGSVRVRWPLMNTGAGRYVARRIKPLNRPISFQQVHDIWNRSKISYTPMGASTNPNLLQIKGRTFEMGLSGTMMLSQHSPSLERYYEPHREFVPFENLDDCAEKARWYLRNEAARVKIAQAYFNRTRAEHMWEQRFEKLFQDAGIASRPLSRAA